MIARSAPVEGGFEHGEQRETRLPEPNTRLVEGSERDPRRLTVDFASFVQRLGKVPEPDHARLARLVAGVDLVDGLTGPSNAGFGSATPGVREGAEISEELAAITDEALDAAEELLNAVPTYEDDYDMEEPPDGLYTTEMTLALELLGNDGLSAARQAIMRSPPAIERAIGPEFI